MAAAVKARVAVVRELMMKMQDTPRWQAMSALQAAALKEELSSARCQLGLVGNLETSFAAVCLYVFTMHLLLTYVLVSLEAPRKQTHMSTTNATIRYSSQPV